MARGNQDRDPARCVEAPHCRRIRPGDRKSSAAQPSKSFAIVLSCRQVRERRVCRKPGSGVGDVGEDMTTLLVHTVASLLRARCARREEWRGMSNPR